MESGNTEICIKKPIRRWDIDWLRVICIFFVFVIHSSLPFDPTYSYPMKNDFHSHALGFFNFWQRGWIMPLVMLLAGSSVWFSLKKRTNEQYIKERINRVLLPVAICIPIFVSFQVYLERLYHGQFTGSFFQFFPHFFNGIYPNGNFSYHHLWFLVYLFSYSLVTLPLFRFLKSDSGNRCLKRVAGWCQTPATIFLFVIPLIIGQLILGQTYPKVHNFYNDLAWHWQLLSSFILGFILISDSRFQQAIEKMWKVALVLGIASNVILYFYNDLYVQIINNVYPHWLDFFFGTVLHRLGSWSCIIALLGFSQTFLNFRNKVLDYTSEAAYPFYIVHPSAVGIMIYFILPMDIGLWVKWLLILPLSLLLSIATFEILKRWSFTRFIIGLR